jgi:hypothetical protein
LNEARAISIFALFGVGFLGGVVVHGFVDRGPAENPYPTLPKVEEPRAAQAVVAAIAANDPRSLAQLMPADLLSKLDAALEPVVDVRSTKFVGAVESERTLLSGYTVTGKTQEGVDFVVGFVLRVANDQVVGVN